MVNTSFSIYIIVHPNGVENSLLIAPLARMASFLDQQFERRKQ